MTAAFSRACEGSSISSAANAGENGLGRIRLDGRTLALGQQGGSETVLRSIIAEITDELTVVRGSSDACVP
jgi:hypothetical protein